MVITFRCRNRPHRVKYRCKENSFFAFRRVANLCDIAHADTSCNQVFANRIPSPAPEHFSTLANSTQDHPTETHATHHDDAALRLDAKQSPHLSLQSSRETKLATLMQGSLDHTSVQLNQKNHCAPNSLCRTNNAKRGCLMEDSIPNEKTASF